MNEIKYYEEIEDYASGNMPSSKRKAFEDKLASDPALSEEYTAYLNAQKALKVLQATYLKNKLAGPIQLQEAKIVPFRKRRTWWAAAAAFLALLSATVWYANTQYSEPAIATAYYQSPNLSGTKSVDATRALEGASSAFNKKDYKKAIDLTSTVPKADKNYGHAQFILGHAHFKLNDMPLAKAAFNNVTAIGKSEKDYHDAKWHLALIFLKEKKEQEAVKILDEIISENGGYAKAAKELKGQLDSFWRRLVF